LRNHADGIASIDLFVVPTVSFRLLYGLLIVGLGRRQILWLGVTAHPTAEWIANQLTEACGWEQAPRYLIRDRDHCYGNVFIRRVRSLGIRDRPTSPRSPWQNGYAERLIESIRRECLDHVVVFGERHLRHLLLSYKVHRRIQQFGAIEARLNKESLARPLLVVRREGRGPSSGRLRAVGDASAAVCGELEGREAAVVERWIIEVQPIGAELKPDIKEADPSLALRRRARIKADRPF
jgi:hypothetical protein